MKLYGFSVALFLILFFAACETTDEKEQGNKNVVGGTLRFSEQAFITSMFPHSISDPVSMHMVSQVYDGLVRFNAKDLSVMPAIAMDWELDSSETVYRFFLRSDVYFHDDPCFPEGKGRKVTASDVVFSFSLLCSQNDRNVNFIGTLDQVFGAASHYYDGKDHSISPEGIQAENDSVVIIRIDKPNPMFLYFLANPAASIIPKEAFEKYGYRSYVGTGPFVVSHFPNPGDSMLLLRNNRYFRTDDEGRHLPYMDSVIVFFYGNSSRELALLSKGQLDLVLNLNTEAIGLFVEKNIQEFQSDNPTFVLEQMQNGLELIRSADVFGLRTNSQGFLDFSVVCFISRMPLGSKKQS
jgi:peptide/nickel transport system substrate-binding protein